MFRNLYKSSNDRDRSLEETIYSKPVINYKEKSKEKKISVLKNYESDEIMRKNAKINEDNLKFSNLIARSENKDPKENNYNSNIEIIEKPKTPTKRSFIKTYLKDNKDDRSLTHSQMNISHISDDKSQNHSRSYSNTSIITHEKIDYNRLYTKREKAELNLARGFTKDLKKMFDSNIIFYQFLRPTSIIIDIDRQYIEKFKPSIEYFKNSIIGSNIDKNKQINDVSLTTSNISKPDRSKFLFYKD